MKSFEEIDDIMQQIPEEWRKRWCGGQYGPCACIGCVQIGNRAVMVKIMTGSEYKGDPEYIDKNKIPKAIADKYSVSEEEWKFWSSR